MILVDQETRDKISEAAVEVFGTMYFMSVQLLEEVPDEGEWNLDSSYIVATIGFSGKCNATITCSFPSILSRNVAGGFLGLDESEVSDQQALDTMREAVNMVIGGYLGKADPDGDSKLGIPVAELVEDFDPSSFGENNSELLVLRSDYGHIWMSYVGKN